MSIDRDDHQQIKRTGKRSPKAKAETLRRREIRRIKYGK